MESIIFCDKRFQEGLFKVMIEEFNLDERESAEKILNRYKKEGRESVVARLRNEISAVENCCTEMALVSGRDIKIKDCCGLKDLVSEYEVLGMWAEKIMEGLKDDS